MSSSQVPHVLDALVALFTANVPGCRVVDGMPKDLRDRDLIVGWQEGNEPVSFTQAVGPMATTRPRDEEITVPCLLWRTTGDDAISATRLSLYADFALVESTLRTTPDLGLASSLSIRTSLSAGAFQMRREDHFVYTLGFTVTVQARL